MVRGVRYTLPSRRTVAEWSTEVKVECITKKYSLLNIKKSFIERRKKEKKQHKPTLGLTAARCDVNVCTHFDSTPISLCLDHDDDDDDL